MQHEFYSDWCREHRNPRRCVPVHITHAPIVTEQSKLGILAHGMNQHTEREREWNKRSVVLLNRIVDTLFSPVWPTTHTSAIQFKVVVVCFIELPLRTYGWVWYVFCHVYSRVRSSSLSSSSFPPRVRRSTLSQNKWHLFTPKFV